MRFNETPFYNQEPNTEYRAGRDGHHVKLQADSPEDAASKYRESHGVLPQWIEYEEDDYDGESERCGFTERLLVVGEGTDGSPRLQYDLSENRREA